MQLLTDEQFLPAAIDLIASAKKSIFVSTFKAEMTTKPRGRRVVRLFNLLTDKAKSGVDVRFLISKREDYGHIPITNVYAIRHLRKNKVNVRHLRGNRLCHAKIIIIDGEVAILGSHNLSVKSCHNNFEVSLGITDPYIVGQLQGKYSIVWDDAKKG